MNKLIKFNITRRCVLVLQLISLALILQSSVKAAEDEIKIVMLGDSLTAGLGVPNTRSFPAQLEMRLRSEGVMLSIVNAGVSGDTTSAGLKRLNWSVPEDADGVILQLGANDALRGISPKIARNNLRQMIEQLKERNQAVFLMGMLAPPNMGPDYEDSFNKIYPELAKEHKLPLYPFYLDGVAGIPDLNIEDGMHPNEKGYTEMVERIAPVVYSWIMEDLNKNHGN